MKRNIPLFCLYMEGVGWMTWFNAMLDELQHVVLLCWHRISTVRIFWVPTR